MNRNMLIAARSLKTNFNSRGLTAEDMIIQLALQVYSQRQSSISKAWICDRKDAQIMLERESMKSVFHVKRWADTPMLRYPIY